MRFAGFVFGGVLFAATAASAQNVNIRGTVTAFDDKTISVNTRDGRAVQIDLPADMNVSVAKPFALADLKPGMVLGVITIKRSEQTIAIDVRPIPPAARQGLFAYDLAPESTMTNAALEGTVVQMNGGDEIVLNYQSGTVKVLVPPGTPMSQAALGSRSDIKPGETIFAATRPEGGDRYTALRVQVSKDGVKPTQ
jgi:hypothetical protein